MEMEVPISVLHRMEKIFSLPMTTPSRNEFLNQLLKSMNLKQLMGKFMT